MSRLIIFILLGLSIRAYAGSGERNLSVAAIPSNLLENAGVIVRYYTMNLEIQSARKAEMKVSYAFTILNENLMDEAMLVLGYNSFTRIKRLKGCVYDRNGEKVEKIEQDQFYNLSAISGFSVYEDDRMKVCKPKYQTLPFTVEYSYEIDFDGILDYPDFNPIPRFKMAVEEAGLVVSVPDSLGIRYYQRNFAEPPLVEKQKSNDTYSWKLSSIVAMTDESDSPPITETAPSVLLAPRSFVIDNTRGTADSWKNFGMWYSRLTSDRGQLGKETIEKLQGLTSGVTDTVEKIKILYHYLQDKTRYASIQIGIGGWQPIAAAEVDKLGYGDCKALTNYMQALLKVAGITSLYALVNAGEDRPDMIADFPSHQFNHVILCVPLQHDTIWLECTSQDLPAGYLGTFTDDRYVLLIRQDGGFLGRTPCYPAKVNSRVCAGTLTINNTGSAGLTCVTTHQGLFYDRMHEILLSDDQDRRNRILEGIPVPNFQLKNFSLKEDKTSLPGVDEKLELILPDFGSKAGDLVLFAPNQLAKETALSSQVIRRNNPVQIRRSTLKADTIYITIPDGYVITGNPLNIKFSSKFGEYQASTIQQDRKILYTRQLLVWKGSYPRESYEDFLDFFEKVALADAKKLAMKPTP